MIWRVNDRNFIGCWKEFFFDSLSLSSTVWRAVRGRAVRRIPKITRHGRRRLIDCLTSQLDSLCFQSTNVGGVWRLYQCGIGSHNSAHKLLAGFVFGIYNYIENYIEIVFVCNFWFFIRSYLYLVLNTIICLISDVLGFVECMYTLWEQYANGGFSCYFIFKYRKNYKYKHFNIFNWE